MIHSMCSWISLTIGLEKADIFSTYVQSNVTAKLEMISFNVSRNVIMFGIIFHMAESLGGKIKVKISIKNCN